MDSVGDIEPRAHIGADPTARHYGGCGTLFLDGSRAISLLDLVDHLIDG